MSELFSRLFIVSLGAGAVILMILLLRTMKRRLSHKLFLWLWAVAALRLMIPLTIASPVSFLPDSLDLRTFFLQKAAVAEKETGTDTEIWDAAYASYPKEERTSAAGPARALGLRFIEIAPFLWLSGTGVLLIYLAVHMIRLHRRHKQAVHRYENIYWLDSESDAYVYGLIKPRIYLPYNCREEELTFMITHEKAHILHRDPLWKLLGYLILCVYWFNPLIWLGFILFSRDLEFACDERVTEKMEAKDKEAYLKTLLSQSTGRSALFPQPLSFGEQNAARRIRRIAEPCRPSYSFSIMAGFLVLLLTAGSLFSRKAYTEEYQEPQPIASKEHSGQISQKAPEKKREEEFSILNSYIASSAKWPKKAMDETLSQDNNGEGVEGCISFEDKWVSVRTNIRWDYQTSNYYDDQGNPIEVKVVDENIGLNVLMYGYYLRGDEVYVLKKTCRIKNARHTEILEMKLSGEGDVFIGAEAKITFDVRQKHNTEEGIKSGKAAVTSEVSLCLPEAKAGRVRTDKNVLQEINEGGNHETS